MGKLYNEALSYARQVGLDQKAEYDSDNNVVYLGYAFPGALTSQAKWQITKMEYDSNNNMTSMRWAGATDDFTKVWDDRAAYSYVDI